MSQGSIEVPLTQGYVAWIDEIDAERVLSRKWWIDRGRTGIIYAQGHVELHTKVRLHRFILELVDPKIAVDHIDGDGLNNRRLNLRVCTRNENLGNQRSRAGSSRFKGVSWATRDKCWEMSCAQKISRRFNNEEEAARAYDVAARAIFGEFARLNFPTNPEGDDK